MQAEIEMVIRCEVVVKKEENADELKDVVGRDVRSTLSRRTHLLELLVCQPLSKIRSGRAKGSGLLETVGGCAMADGILVCVFSSSATLVGGDVCSGDDRVMTTVLS